MGSEHERRCTLSVTGISVVTNSSPRRQQAASAMQTETPESSPRASPVAPAMRRQGAPLNHMLLSPAYQRQQQMYGGAASARVAPGRRGHRRSLSYEIPAQGSQMPTYHRCLSDPRMAETRMPARAAMPRPSSANRVDAILDQQQMQQLHQRQMGRAGSFSQQVPMVAPRRPGDGHRVVRRIIGTVRNVQREHSFVPPSSRLGGTNLPGQSTRGSGANDSSQGTKKFQCIYCSKELLSKSSLRRHVRMHTGENLLRCRYCGRGCADNNALLSHERTHTGEKPFQCDICKRSFSQRGNRNRHRHSCAKYHASKLQP